MELLVLWVSSLSSAIVDLVQEGFYDAVILCCTCDHHCSDGGAISVPWVRWAILDDGIPEINQDVPS